MSPAARRRLDRALVERGLAASRPQAVALIEQGAVLVSGSVADKPARLVARSEPVELAAEPPPFVSRAGEKLDAALRRFSIPVAGLRALDAGASTGGFTDCLLQAGAASVFSIDVGHGQLHERLRRDSRVTNLERTDIRQVSLADLEGAPVDLVTADLSFISVTRAIPVLVGEVAVEDASVVILVKPQFEAGRAEASRGKGIIRSSEVHRRTLGEVAGALEAAGAVIMGAMPSPITGSAGNIEFLLHARTPGRSEPTVRATSGTSRISAELGPEISPELSAELGALLDEVVAEAHLKSAGSGR